MDVTAIVKAVSAPIINGLFSILKNYSAKDQSDTSIEINIENHVKEILNWSEKIQFFEMHKPNFTDETSIELSFGIPRKFRAKGVNEIVSEENLLELNDNLLILGDPGAGKTTTLKRIARKLLIDEPISENDVYQFPILIKLREIQESTIEQNNTIHNESDDNIVIKQKVDLISQKLAGILGLKIREKIYKNEEIRGSKKINIINIEYYIGDDFVDDAISKILNSIKTVIMIDGLDELPSSIKDAYENSIVTLANKLRESKILLTCRSSGYINRLNGFTFYEIRPLDKGQVDNIIYRWANNPESFIKTLNSLPYADMTNRPLFLNQLIISYNYYDSLPGQPCEIYKRIIHLMLVKWDKDRNIKRKSEYSDFHPDQKINFLSAIAYELTYKIKSKIFDKEELIIAYRRVYDRFSLPIDEAEQVAQEIESHSGIIIKSTDNKYEFSHLSLQEYLCAFFVVRDPTLYSIPQYLQLYPPPVSIAISLSSRPEKLFSNIILRKELLTKTSMGSIKIMISRLYMERPGFSVSEELGLAFFKLMFIANEDIEFADYIAKFFDMPVVNESLSSVLVYFRVVKDKSTYKNYFLKKSITAPPTHYSITPKNGNISRYLFEKFKTACSFNLVDSSGDFVFQKNYSNYN